MFDVNSIEIIPSVLMELRLDIYLNVYNKYRIGDVSNKTLKTLL